MKTFQKTKLYRQGKSSSIFNGTKRAIVERSEN